MNYGATLYGVALNFRTPRTRQFNICQAWASRARRYALGEGAKTAPSPTLDTHGGKCSGLGAREVMAHR